MKKIVLIQLILMSLLIPFSIFSNNKDLDINILDLQERLNEIAGTKGESVVFISTEKTVTQSDPFDFFFRDPWEDDGGNKKKREFKQGGLGSGVIYRKKNDIYYIVTNNHVVEDADTIKVKVDEEKTYDGKIIGTDPDVDIAVVEITTKDNLNVIDFGDSDKLKTGDFVIAIGNPFGLQGTMTFGIISALGRSDLTPGRVNLTNFIQTDAAINPGNSGGPLLNINGEVIGINTLIYTRSGGNVGIGFAIPVNIAKTVADQIIENGKVEHGYLGVNFEELDEEKIKILNLGNIKHGMHILKVMEGSAADKADLKAGDVILEVNGKTLRKSSDLTFSIGNSKPGDRVKLKILRDGKTVDKTVILGSRDEMNEQASNDSEIIEDYGFELAELSNDIKKEYEIPDNIKGVIIIDINQRGPAARSGMKQGDVIYKVNTKKIDSINDLKKIIEKSESTNYFFINRNGSELIIRM